MTTTVPTGTRVSFIVQFEREPDLPNRLCQRRGHRWRSKEARIGIAKECVRCGAVKTWYEFDSDDCH